MLFYFIINKKSPKISKDFIEPLSPIEGDNGSINGFTIKRLRVAR